MIINITPTAASVTALSAPFNLTAGKIICSRPLAIGLLKAVDRQLLLAHLDVRLSQGQITALRALARQIDKGLYGKTELMHEGYRVYLDDVPARRTYRWRRGATVGNQFSTETTAWLDAADHARRNDI